MVQEIADGQSRAFMVTWGQEKIELAVINLGGRFYAILNSCAHKGGPPFTRVAGRGDRDVPVAWVEILCR